MDFSLILFILVCVTGLIWGLDHWIWSRTRRRRQATASKSKAEGAHRYKEPVLVEYARAFFPVILIVFLLRSFLVEPFRIPSGSMLPSLLIGDFILVNKFSYGIRLPVINVKVLDTGAPKRGDVIVFRFPRDPSTNYIKRVVGVPGDVVLYKDKKVFVNGELMTQRDGQPYNLEQFGESDGTVTRYTETLSAVDHGILVNDRPTGPDGRWEIPTGQYFVMGDNRDRSNDSRYWGFVPDGNLVGKAFLIWFSWDMVSERLWFWQRVAWSRIGSQVH